MTPELRAAVENGDSESSNLLANLALYVIPDLHIFSVSGGSVEGAHASIHDDFVSWSYMATASAYGLVYIGVLLGLSIVIFSRRDFV